MVTRQEVEGILDHVMVPQVKRSVNDMNLLRNVETEDGKLKVTLSKSAISPEFQTRLADEVKDVLKGCNGGSVVKVDYELLKPVEVNKIDHVIAVMSGKGGVGKSLITGLLAMALANEGKNVGILDADITGPSIPKMFGIKTQASGSETGFLPAVSRTGIEIMSMNLLLPNEDDAVIWRGPLIAKCINQFWGDVLWGKLDYLVIDLPPGTADVPLTVMKSLPLSGVIIAFTPQDLTAMVVRKAVKMANQLNVPILGVVENMSYFLIPETGRKIDIFGPSRGDEMANICGAPLLGQIPLDPELAKLCDEGRIESYDAESALIFRQSVIKELLTGHMTGPAIA